MTLLNYCDTALRGASAMAGTIEMAHLALIERLMKALQGVGHAPTPTISLPRFLGRVPAIYVRQSQMCPQLDMSDKNDQKRQDMSDKARCVRQILQKIARYVRQK